MTVYCIEGIDGSGKSTLAKALSARLNGCPVIEFPRRDTQPVGPLIRDYLNGTLFGPVEFPHEQEHAAIIHQCLQFADKADAAPLIHDAWEKGTDLILVRYWPSAVVYGLLDRLNKDWLLRLREGLPDADVNVLVGTPPEEAKRRMTASRGTKEAYETLEKLVRASDLYMDLWKNANTSYIVTDGLTSTDRQLDFVLSRR